MLNLDPQTIADCEKPLRAPSLTVLQATTLLGALQLTLRHPAFRQNSAAGFIDQFAHDLQKEILAQAPGLAMLCDAGWKPQFDTRTVGVDPTAERAAMKRTHGN